MKDGWSQSKVLEFGTRDALTLQAKFRRPQYHTLQFSVIPQSVLADTILAPEVTVRWSVEGNHVERKLSAINGMALSGTAKAVSIEIRDTPVSGLGVIPPGQLYFVSVQVSPGARASGPVPANYRPDEAVGTLSTVTIAPGVAQSFQVPVDVGLNSHMFNYAWLSTVNGVPGIGELDVSQRGPGSVGDLARYDGRDTGLWIPLSPGAAELLFFNTNLSGQNETILLTNTFGVEG